MTCVTSFPHERYLHVLSALFFVEDFTTCVAGMHGRVGIEEEDRDVALNSLGDIA